MFTLAPTPSPGLIHDLIERMKADLRRLERECSGVVVTGSWAEDLKDMAHRLDSLTRPDKGHLKEEFKDAA